ncbi:MAG: hypothetical protein AAF518_14915 [Spirochaetota bacterium]
MLKRLFCESILLSLGLLIFFSTNLAVTASQTQKVRIAWEAVAGVKTYQLEVRTLAGTSVVKQKLQQTYWDAELPVGAYEKRISVYNKLGEIAARSDWQALNVLGVRPMVDTELEWLAVEDVKEYRIELRNSKGELIYSKKVKGLRVALKLEPGDYSRRLSVYNKLGELDAQSDWTPYRIIIKERDPNTQDWKIVARSSLIPGWGQYYAATTYPDWIRKGFPKARGVVYLTTFVAATGYYFYSVYAFQRAKKKYNRSILTSLLIASSVPASNRDARNLLVLSGANQVVNGYSGVLKILNDANIALAIMAGVYVIQVVDAYWINRSVNDTKEEKKQGLGFGVSDRVLEAGTESLLEKAYQVEFYKRF